MKVIYLDIDGVMNSAEFDRLICNYRHGGIYNIFDQRACLRLMNLIDETGAYVILSSSWRIDENSRKEVDIQLRPYRIKVVGYTGQERGQRGDQIAAHLAAHPEITEYVVFDDDDDMDAVRSHFVKTTFEHGLQDEHIELAKQILNGHLLEENN